MQSRHSIPAFRDRIRRYFDLLASDYSDIMAPVLQQIVQGIMEPDKIARGEYIADIGAATDLLTSMVGEQGALLVSVDLSLAMGRAARLGGGKHFVVSDAHALGFGSRVFDKAIASFVLNSTEPVMVLPEIGRILKSGGQLLIQEWGPEDELTACVNQIFPLYLTECPSKQLSLLRELWEEELPWDRFETSDDMEFALIEAGYSEIVTKQESSPVLFKSVTDFVQYKLAWPSRRLELAEMSTETRRLCVADLTENLELYTGQDGTLVWQPEIMRLSATYGHIRTSDSR